MSIKIDFTNYGFFKIASFFYRYISGSRYRVFFIPDPPGTNFFLQEDGTSYILLENGVYRLKLEG